MKRLVLLLAALGACTTTESSDVFTSGIYASITAEAKGDGKTDVGATLYVGNPLGLNFVQLSGDDRLIAIQGNTSRPMVEAMLLNVVSHHAEFATDAAGTEFEVVFDRQIDDGAPTSIATLPAKFDITGGAGAQSRSSTFAVSWSPSGSTDLMSWQVHGDCIEDESAPITGDTGSVLVPAGVLKKRMGNNIADQCDVTFTIKRSKPGLLDPGYGKGGTIFGIQTRSVIITSTP